jgi:hypothetical protein
MGEAAVGRTRGLTTLRFIPHFETKLDKAFMIRPGVLTRTIVGACDAALAELNAKRRHPVPASDITPQQGFNLNGAAEWDRYRTQFREPTKQAAE